MMAFKPSQNRPLQFGEKLKMIIKIVIDWERIEFINVLERGYDPTFENREISWKNEKKDKNEKK